MANLPSTARQVADNSILDVMGGKQTYLGNQFIYTNPIPSFATTAELPVFLMTNPAITTSAFPSAWTSLFVNLNKCVTTTASQSVIFRFYLNPTVTGAGTAKTPINLRTGSATTSVATIATLPSVSANGTLYQMLASQPFSPDLSSVLAIIDPGKSLLITAQATATATTAIQEISWWEL